MSNRWARGSSAGHLVASARGGRSGVLAVALGATLLVAACTGAAESGSTSGSGVASAAPSVVPSGSPASAGPSGTAASCRSSDLAIKVVLDPGRHTAGSTYYPIVFTNSGAAACTLFGYPGVSFVAGQGGSQIGKPAGRNGQPPTTVVLAAAGAAQAILQIADAGVFDPSACQATKADWLRVFPPGETVPLYLAFTPETAICGGSGVDQLTIAPVSPPAG